METEQTLQTGDLTVAAVARRLGIAPATLRTWDRRYGLGPTEHNAGTHRRYSLDDLARVTMMRRLTLAGMAPAQAAEEAKSFTGGLAGLESLPLIPNFEVKSQVVEYLYNCAKSMDSKSFSELLNRELDSSTVEEVYESIIVPLLQMVGEMWATSGNGIAIEHLISNLIIGALSDSTLLPTSPINDRPVLLSCVEDEPHSIPLHALTASLSQRNIAFISLGAKTPQVAISEVVTRCAPPVIFLWSQRAQTAHLDICQSLPDVRPAAKLILGGPGWNEVEVEGAVYVSTLSEACSEISSTFTL